MLQQFKNIYHLFQSLAANIYYGFPGRKLQVIGVTGTSGKTTTTMMLYHVLQTAGYKVSVLSTIKAVIGGKAYDTGFHVTTPAPHVLPKYLKQAVDNGDTHFVLEVSSHALDQNRAAFIPFRIGILTSLAHEHLDYHKTMANYARAKFKLLHAARSAILPVSVLDMDLLKIVDFHRLRDKVVTFGIEQGDVTQKTWQLSLQLPGDFNILNGLATAAACSQLGVEEDSIKNALKTFSGVPGRFEQIPNKRGLTLIVDFAHKPDALEGVLQVAQKMVKKENKIIVMYGCASERDTLKRPIMGKISATFADVTVLTDEDPRFEDPMKILDEIAQGCEEAGAQLLIHDKKTNPVIHTRKHVYYKIPGRQDAIDFIITALAKKGDIILLCGKGHETSMNYRGVEQPWSEHEAVKKSLAKKYNE